MIRVQFHEIEIINLTQEREMSILHYTYKTIKLEEYTYDHILVSIKIQGQEALDYCRQLRRD